MAEKANWTEWQKEQRAFQSRETEGFTKDLSALEAHIKRLTEVSPKDDAGWPTGTALRVIAELQKQHSQIKNYLWITTEGTETPPDQILEG